MEARCPSTDEWIKQVWYTYACMHNQPLSHVQLFGTPWTIACQDPLSMGLSWQEYWSGMPFPTPGNPPDPGIKPTSPVAPVLAGGLLNH